MTEPGIRLDRSKPFGECRGERTPDDPHYSVHFWQGGLMGGHRVLLPFDSQGELVRDDGKTEPYQGINSDGKPITHQPLYTKQMRAFLEAKKKKAAAAAAPGPNDIQEPESEENEAETNAALEDEVNFVSWLKGEVRYQPHLLRGAALKRYGKRYTKLPGDLVVDLVLDEHIVAEDQVCAELARYLPKAAAA